MPIRMPELPVESIVSCADYDDGEAKLLCAAFTKRGVPDGLLRLRASKPFKQVTSAFEGYANYVWRMLCFDLVGQGKHACMPVCAEFEVLEGYEFVGGSRPRYGQDGRDPNGHSISYEEWNRQCRLRREWLDELTKRFESALPPGSMKGIIRWGRALGMI